MQSYLFIVLAAIAPALGQNLAQNPTAQCLAKGACDLGTAPKAELQSVFQKFPSSFTNAVTTNLRNEGTLKANQDVKSFFFSGLCSLSADDRNAVVGEIFNSTITASNDRCVRDYGASACTEVVPAFKAIGSFLDARNADGSCGAAARYLINA